MKSSPCTATFSTTASWTGWTNCSLATSSLTRPSTSETLPVIGNIRDTAEAMELRDRDPLGHHVTNIVVTEQTDSEPHVRSKGIGGMTDGRSAAVTYEDVVVRTSDGWRIGHRKRIPRRKPLTRCL